MVILLEFLILLLMKNALVFGHTIGGWHDEKTVKWKWVDGVGCEFRQGIFIESIPSNKEGGDCGDICLTYVNSSVCCTHWTYQQDHVCHLKQLPWVANETRDTPIGTPSSCGFVKLRRCPDPTPNNPLVENLGLDPRIIVAIVIAVIVIMILAALLFRAVYLNKV